MSKTLGLVKGIMDTLLPAGAVADESDVRPDQVPQVDTAGAGDSPVTPPLEGANLNRQTLPPVPIIDADASKPLAGAPKGNQLGAPGRVLAATGYRLANDGKPVLIVPGSSAPRRVLIWLAIGPENAAAGQVYISQDVSAAATGAPITTGLGAIELHASDPIYAVWPTVAAPGANVPTLGVVVEPVQGAGCCAK